MSVKSLVKKLKRKELIRKQKIQNKKLRRERGIIEPISIMKKYRIMSGESKQVRTIGSYDVYCLWICEFHRAFRVKIASWRRLEEDSYSSFIITQRSTKVPDHTVFKLFQQKRVEKMFLCYLSRQRFLAMSRRL